MLDPRDRHGRTIVTRKALLIINPEARHGETAALVPVIKKLLANLPHETVLTERMGHAAEIAAGAGGYGLVVAAGGDGTVHEVLNGLMAMPDAERPTLGV
ncbi:MAG: diacylglycerol kinase family lipid kinase, partial [Actinobacteria bacterium]